VYDFGISLRAMGVAGTLNNWYVGALGCCSSKLGGCAMGAKAL
jgi:hypothetical protein